MSKTSNVKKTVLCAMFTALTCIATMVIQIKTPLGGYVNLGDCMVLASAWFLGPWYGMFAAGVGSMLSDLLFGYMTYVPATFVIKALMALVACIIVSKRNQKNETFFYVLSAFAAEIIMIGGYFLFEWIFIAKSLVPALGGIPGNCVQGIFGIVLSVILAKLLKKPFTRFFN